MLIFALKFTLRAHLNLDRPHCKCSTATWGSGSRWSARSAAPRAGALSQLTGIPRRATSHLFSEGVCVTSRSPGQSAAHAGPCAASASEDSLPCWGQSCTLATHLWVHLQNESVTSAVEVETAPAWPLGHARGEPTVNEPMPAWEERSMCAGLRQAAAAMETDQPHARLSLPP